MRHLDVHALREILNTFWPRQICLKVLCKKRSYIHHINENTPFLFGSCCSVPGSLWIWLTFSWCKQNSKKKVALFRTAYCELFRHHRQMEILSACMQQNNGFWRVLPIWQVTDQCNNQERFPLPITPTPRMQARTTIWVEFMWQISDFVIYRLVPKSKCFCSKSKQMIQENVILY